MGYYYCYYFVLLSLCCGYVSAVDMDWQQTNYIEDDKMLLQPRTMAIVKDLLILDDESNGIKMLNLSTVAFNTTFVTIYPPGGGVSGLTGYTDRNTSYIWYCMSSGCYRVSEPFNNFTSAIPLQNSDTPRTVSVDVTFRLLYSVSISNKVYIYNLDNFSKPIFNFDLPGYDSIIKIVPACNRDYFLIELNRHVIHHFSYNATTPDYNITTEGGSRPNSAVLNYNCRVMWIVETDRNRIAKHRYPFGPASLNSTLDVYTRPRDIALQRDLGKLWYTGYSHHRVVAGNTSDVLYSPRLIPVTPGEVLTCTTQTSTFCFVSTPVVVGNNTLQFNFTTVYVNASIIFSNSSEFVLNSGQNLITSGNVTFGGNLTLTLLPGSHLDGSPVTVVEYDSSQGQFSNIIINGLETNECEEASFNYGEKSLQLIFTLRDECKEVAGSSGDGLSKGAIAGITIGVVFGVLLLFIIIVALVGAIVLYIRRRRSTDASLVSHIGL